MLDLKRQPMNVFPVKHVPNLRRKNIAYNETQHERTTMDKNKIAKLVVKGVIGLAVSAAIGTMIKTEKAVGTAIDEYFKKD